MLTHHDEIKSYETMLVFDQDSHFSSATLYGTPLGGGMMHEYTQL